MTSRCQRWPPCSTRLWSTRDRRRGRANVLSPARRSGSSRVSSCPACPSMRPIPTSWRCCSPASSASQVLIPRRRGFRSRVSAPTRIWSRSTACRSAPGPCPRKPFAPLASSPIPTTSPAGSSQAAKCPPRRAGAPARTPARSHTRCATRIFSLTATKRLPNRSHPALRSTSSRADSAARS